MDSRSRRGYFFAHTVTSPNKTVEGVLGGCAASAANQMILEGKLVVADLGYRGESEFIATPNSHDTAEVRAFKSRILARHESFNGKVKQFKILRDRFRHGVEKHSMAFEAACVITQYRLEHGSALMSN
jgi:hypothetical protein